MILDREKAVEMFQVNRSRYLAMSRSAEKEDLANAEAARLTSEVWDLLASDLAERRGAQLAASHFASAGGAGFAPGAPAAGAEEIDVGNYPKRLAELWSRFVGTHEVLDEGAITLSGDIVSADKPHILDEALWDDIYPRGIDQYVVEMKKLLRVEDEDRTPAGIQGSLPAPEAPAEPPAAEPARVGGRTRATAAAGR